MSDLVFAGGLDEGWLSRPVAKRIGMETSIPAGPSSLMVSQWKEAAFPPAPSVQENGRFPWEAAGFPAGLELVVFLGIKVDHNQGRSFSESTLHWN